MVRINSKNSKLFVFFNLNLVWWAPFIDPKLQLNHGMSGWSTHGCPLEVKGNISLHMWIRVSGYPCRYKILNFPSNNSVSALSVINMWRVQLQKVYPWCFFKHSVFFSQEKRQIQPFPRGKGKKNSAHENVWCRYVVSVYSVPWQYAILWKIQ